MATNTKAKGFWAYLILFLIPAVLIVAGGIIVHNSTKAHVIKHEGFTRPGYENAPTDYHVDASPSRVFADYLNGGMGIFILGILLACVAPVAYTLYTESEVKPFVWPIVGLCWLIGLLLCFGIPAIMGENVRYTKTVSEPVYQQYETHLDDLFAK